MTLRAVIYARCSTEEESQKDALIKQAAEAKECVLKNGWTLVDSYVESRSGTTTKGRIEYNRLYEDLTKDRFDIIVIKSQDRLMRNTKDWYLFVDRLVTEQKKLYMYIEHKFYSADDALITGIKAILAEEYSRELSKKINNAHRNRQKNNGPVILTSNTYGFRKMPDKSIILDEKEAEIKKRMYELCAAGYGCRTIANILKNEGVVNRKGKPFTEATILKILHNPLNKGTVVMNKRHYDFESKRILKIPKEEQYVYKNKVPAIVSEELWELANQEIARRTSRKKTLDLNIHEKEKIIVPNIYGKNPGKSQLSGKIFCGVCDSPYYRSTRRRYRDGKNIYEWKCKRYLEVGRNTGKADRPQIRKVQLDKIDGCDNIHLQEEQLYELLEKVARENYASDKEKIIRDMVSLLKSVLKEKDLQPELDRELRKKEKLLNQRNTLVEKLLEGVLSDEAYQGKYKELEEKLAIVQESLSTFEKQKSKGNILKDRIQNIEAVLRKGNVVEKATVAGMMEEVEKILIYPKYMEIYFSLAKMIGIENDDISNEKLNNVLCIEYGNLFNYRKKKQEEREIIIDLIGKNPKITARMIAEKLGISLSGANYKLNALKKEGRIKFHGSGGKGEWEVLK